VLVCRSYADALSQFPPTISHLLIIGGSQAFVTASLQLPIDRIFTTVISVKSSALIGRDKCDSFITPNTISPARFARITPHAPRAINGIYCQDVIYERC
jgi:hypothetical protein